MKAARSLIPLALFALAFLVALFALRQPRPAAPEPMNVSPAAQLLRVASVASEARPAIAATVSASPAAKVRAPIPPTGSVVPPDADEPPASAGPATAERSFAVAEAVDALTDSGSADDRVRAIQSLAASARDGYDVARVRSSLRLASADANPDVAARAQEEWERLVEREEH
ncbi:MAG: hypothetical protein WDO68_08305 [Gammaproteobacteria bacterium]